MHLQDALFEVSKLCPSVVVHLSCRCDMLCWRNDAVPIHQPSPARQQKGSHNQQLSDQKEATALQISEKVNRSSRCDLLNGQNDAVPLH